MLQSNLPHTLRESRRLQAVPRMRQLRPRRQSHSLLRERIAHSLRSGTKLALRIRRSACATAHSTPSRPDTAISRVAPTSALCRVFLMGQAAPVSPHTLNLPPIDAV